MISCARSLSLSLLLATALPACSMRRLAVDQTAAILTNALPAFEREWDHELVADALPATIKTIEGLLVNSPGNKDLLLGLARAYTSYALVVLEDRMERARATLGDDEEDSPRVRRIERLRLRLREMYLRGHRYGLRLMNLRRSGFSEAFGRGREKLDDALEGCDQDDVPALFWTVMPLASAINVGRDDVSLIGELPKVRVIMERVLELDETYYNAGPHLVLGALYGGVSKMYGGDPAKAKKHFSRALTLTKRRFLLVQEMYARTLAVHLQDRKLFKSLLGEVLAADLEVYPEQMLANVTAKRRARRLLARIDELF